MIYEPAGKAREYSPFAINHYKGCTHGCVYCYVPNILGRFNPSYKHGIVEQKDLSSLESELQTKQIDKQVLLSFTTDPYNHFEPKFRSTRKVLELFKKYEVPTAILSKGGKRILADLDIFQTMNIKIGQTLVTSSQEELSKNEPNASSYEERIEVFKTLHENGIKTFISIEPLCDSSHLKKLVDDTIENVDEYMIGKLSGGTVKTRIVPEEINTQLARLRLAGKKIYVKHSLRDVAKYIQGVEDDMNRNVLVRHKLEYKQKSLF
jgi:DNA repair photolyase